MKKLMLFAISALFVGLAYAQTPVTNTDLKIIRVNKDISTHFVTGAKIKYVDISSSAVEGDAPSDDILRIKPVEEKIKVKKRGAWAEEAKEFIDGQSLGVVTIATETYITQYALVYSEIPSDAVTNYLIPQEEKQGYKNPKTKMSGEDMVNFCWRVWNEPANYHDVRSKKDKLIFKLNNIFTISDYFFIDVELSNKANIKYDIDQVSFKIVDKHISKSTNVQEVPVKCVRQLFDIKDFKKNYRNVFVFDKFSFSDEKVFVIEMAEKQYSSRNIELRIDYSYVLNADTFTKTF